MSSTEPPYVSMLEQAGQADEKNRAKEPVTGAQASEIDVARLFERTETPDSDQSAS